MAINKLIKQKMRVPMFVAVLLAVFSSTALYADQVRTGIVQQSLGRDFGILVGDIIEHYYIVQVPAEYRLTPASLPPNGELDYWLLLLDSDYEVISENAELRRYRLHFTFQTFYAPLDVRALATPPLTVSFNAGDKTEQLTIPAWNFTMSPLKEIAPRGVAKDSNQNAFMKADLAPSTIPTKDLQQQIWILSITLLILVILWLTLKGYLFALTRSPFQQAYHQVKKLRKYHNDESAFHQALQAVHRAFNRLAGHALFAHQTDQFIDKHKEFSGYQDQIDSFYQLSTEALYADQKLPTEKDFDQLLKLCKQLAGAEKLALKKS